jgi:DNA-directed RNA polymerase
LLTTPRAGTPLGPILPYVQHQEIGVKNLISGLLPEAAPAALDALEEFATKSGRLDIKRQVEAARMVEVETRAFEDREKAMLDVPEVEPVLDGKGKQVASSKSEDPEVINESNYKFHPQARFVITNLRDTLKNIQTPLSDYNRQMALEKASYEAAEEELKHSAKLLEEAGVVGNQRLQRDVLQGYMHRWHLALTDYIEADIKKMRASVKDSENDVAAPRWNAAASLKDSTMLLYLTVLPPKKLALITILELMRMVGSGGIVDGMKTLRGCIGVGKAIEAEHRAETIRNVAGPGSTLWQKTLDSKTLKPDRSSISRVWAEIGREREERLELEAEATAGNDVDPAPAPSGPTDIGNDVVRSVWTPPWTQMVQMSIGSHLVDALIKTARVTRHGKDPETGDSISEEQAAFNHSYEYVRGRKLGVIRLNPAVADRLATDSVRQVIHPKHLPMLVPPRPWASWNSGAYLATPVLAMRFKDSVEQMNYLREASRAKHLDSIFHGLDVLSSTPWRINRKVFDVVLDAWNQGEAIADIPGSPENTTYNVPADLDPRDNDPLARSEYHERQKAASAQMRKDHGERCKYNYNLEIARSYLNDTFYIPHNMDFRGRAYPIPPHLSPVGDDLCRGLLTFGTKKPLGATGLKWLQIHLANVFGFDKASFDERAQFAMTHVEDVFDSADNPLTGRRWWLTAEDPWQCLATCFELAAALRSPDPTLFESSLPVHQDGTCNGMQHYAALGGDVRGAKAVNLEKGDRPADIYSGVADLVNKSIEEDQKKGMPVALSLELPLGRKVVKQTVMTTVYGVTFIGAREQIAKQLHARGGLASDEVYVASTYVARKVLDSIGDLFSGARAIQDWLTFSARLIARSIASDRLNEAAELRASEEGVKKSRSKASKTKKARLAKELMTAVVWTTPLGLPVVQPYRKEAKKQVMTSLQTVYISDPNVQTEVSPQKQATAFPPNYIHSLDATHMLLTAAKCNQKDISFASVHDSYWTHAATVETMSETIRDTFIHLHSQDLVGELRNEFLQRYGDHYIPINAGTTIMQQVKTHNKAAKERKARSEATSSTEAAESPESASTDEAGESSSAASLEATENETDDVEMSIAEIGDEIELKTLAGQKFVRFRDVLPPTPPRGQFDVERIRESQYFFS